MPRTSCTPYSPRSFNCEAIVIVRNSNKLTQLNVYTTHSITPNLHNPRLPCSVVADQNSLVVPMSNNPGNNKTIGYEIRDENKCPYPRDEIRFVLAVRRLFT